MRLNAAAALVVECLVLLCAPRHALSQQPGQRVPNRDAALGEAVVAEDAASVLPPEQWRRVDRAAERALAWLAGQQRDDGSFPTLDAGQPGVTCLCIMAFMAHGHLPGEGPYGTRLERATDYAVNCQKANGLVALMAPEGPQISRLVQHEIGSSSAYNHGISSLALSEVYGTTRRRENERLQRTIQRAIRATLEMQRWPKDRDVDRGGWRYLNDFNREDSDLSITGWQLKFLRSARNCGFDVPKSAIDDAVNYVRRTYSPHLFRAIRSVRVRGRRLFRLSQSRDGRRRNSSAGPCRRPQHARGQAERPVDP
jgi:hypothetical protein